jgi:hypothetical protein
MAIERRYHNYRDPIKSSTIHESAQGILPAGRYRGLNEIDNPSGLGFDLVTTGNSLRTRGFRFVDNETPANNADDQGVVVTPEGQVVHFDGATALAFVTNSGNLNDRIDLIIYRQDWDTTVGGVAGTFIVIQGGMGGPVTPSIPDPDTDAAIGYLEIPAGATLASAITYVPYDSPDISGRPSAKVGEYNKFTNLNAFSYAQAGVTEILTSTSAEAIQLSSFANSVNYIPSAHSNIVGIKSPVGYVAGLTYKLTNYGAGPIKISNNLSMPSADELDNIFGILVNSPAGYIVLQPGDSAILELADSQYYIACWRVTPSADNTGEDWITLGTGGVFTYVNNWATGALSSNTARYRVTAAGYVELAGHVQKTAGSFAVENIVTNIPAALMPTTAAFYSAGVMVGLGGSGNVRRNAVLTLSPTSSNLLAMQAFDSAMAIGDVVLLDGIRWRPGI